MANLGENRIEGLLDSVFIVVSVNLETVGLIFAELVLMVLLSFFKLCIKSLTSMKSLFLSWIIFDLTTMANGS